MSSQRLSFALVLVGLLLGQLLTPVHATRATPETCFAETGFCIQGRFLEYWQAHGRLAINGYPVSNERQELLEDGHTYTVQYFERVRMEYHPENQPPYDVLLGFFGRRVERAQFGAVGASALFKQALAPVAPREGASYFHETGHNLDGSFRDYWLANGGLAQFGFPITEEHTERLEDGQTYTVQYFERARFEHHPEYTGTPYAVLLGQFGRQIAREATLLTGPLGQVYNTRQEVRDQLGAPLEAPVAMAGALQEFEHGQMVWLGDRRTYYWGREAPQGREVPVIYLFVGGVQSGSLLNYFQNLEWPDTWQEGEPVGGRPGPQPGLYEPKRGFGKVWRLGTSLGFLNEPPHSDVRDALGYAVTADERGYTLLVQRFQDGFMLSTLDSRFVYAVATGRASNSSATFGVYARYEVPTR